MLRDLIRALGITKAWIYVTLGLAVLWIAIVVFSAMGWNPFGLRWNFANPGAFGDSFGPLSTLMAALAALGAIAAYRVQVQETTRTKARQEEQDLIGMSDRERFLRREIEADKRLEKSTFESTFFKLLESFRSIVSATDIRKADRSVVSAHDAYQFILKRMDYYVSVCETKSEAWDKLSTSYMNDLSHYFRFLYHVVKFVDQSTVENKYFYVRLVRAMLSESELVLLALNGEYGEGREKFKALIEKYSLLHNVSPEARSKWKLDDVYAEGAFVRQISDSESDDLEG